MNQVNETAGAILGIVAVLGIVVTWVKWLRPRFHARELDRIAQRDALIGRPPVLDSITGDVLAPALLGIGQRMAHQEEQMAEMTRAVTQLAETHAQMAEIRREVHDLSGRVGKLEEAHVERVVSKAESAAAWRAMEAATLATPDQVADEAPDLP